MSSGGGGGALPGWQPRATTSLQQSPTSKQFASQKQSGTPGIACAPQEAPVQQVVKPELTQRPSAKVNENSMLMNNFAEEGMHAIGKCRLT